MIDRIARGLAQSRGIDFDALPETHIEASSIHMHAHCKDDYREIVRTVLQLAEEPTRDMVDVARDPRTANGSPMSKGPHDVWRAMVKQALRPAHASGKMPRTPNKE